MSFKEFTKTLFKSINPERYNEISSRNLKDASKYIFSVLFLSFVVMLLLMLPFFGTFPLKAEQAINSFTVINLNPNIETQQPIIFPAKQQWLIIDTTGTTTNLSEGKILITQDKVYNKAGLCFWMEPACMLYKPENRVEQKDLTEYTDIKNHAPEISAMITTLFILALPTIILGLYLVLLIKYTLIILAASVLMFGISKILKKDTRYKTILKMSMYSCTILIVLDVVLMPLKINLRYMPLAIYAILLFIGTYLISEHEITRESTKKQYKHHEEKHKTHSTEEDEYIDVALIEKDLKNAGYKK